MTGSGNNQVTEEKEMENPGSGQSKRSDEDIAERYSGLPTWDDLFGISSRTDFPDDAYRNVSAVELFEISNRSVVKYGRELFNGLMTGVNRYVVGTIFLLAFQLRVPAVDGSGRLFPSKDELAGVGDVPVENLDKEPRFNGASQVCSEEGTEEELAMAYAFVAGSLLRLFSRPAQTYTKSWQQIIGGYRRFYRTPFPITGVNLSANVMDIIHSHFFDLEIFKSSLFRILYNANRNKKGEGLKRFLYDNYLPDTGMHVVPITFRLCQTLNCSPEKLFAVIYARMFEKEIEELKAAFELANSQDEGHRRQMWRYGRIFYTDFMANLQTKRCLKLVYLLAYTLKLKDPSSNENILQIKQLEVLPMEYRARLERVAEEILKIINCEEPSCSQASQVFK